MKYDRQYAILALEKYLKPDRIKHCFGVEEYARKLARIYSETEELCSIAGLLHDLARDFDTGRILPLAEQFGYPIDGIYRRYPKLLHGPASAQIAKTELGIDNVLVLGAIANHTIPAEHMTRIDKIIFIADKLEEGRSYSGVEEIRKLSETDLDECFYSILKQTINYLVSKNQIIHPGTIKAYNNHIESNKTLFIDK